MSERVVEHLKLLPSLMRPPFEEALAKARAGLPDRPLRGLPDGSGRLHPEQVVLAPREA